MNYINVVKRWERIYLEEGAEGLMKERRGRACAAGGTRKGRPPKLDKKVEEDLISENQRLRMEIEYLKKLSALVLAEERKNGYSINHKTVQKLMNQLGLKEKKQKNGKYHSYKGTVGKVADNIINRDFSSSKGLVKRSVKHFV